MGYHDSGMEGWPQNDAPDSFWQAPVAEAGHRLAELMRRYQPQVVVTYDENGFYGHPDHIQANRITLAAIAECGIPDKLYYTAVPRSAIRGLRDTLASAGVETPMEVEENPDFGTPDELVTTTVDCSAVAGRKFASLAAHASQSENIFFLGMGQELFASFMGRESFVRVQDSTSAPTPEDDLFAGLRPEN
jgi:LmbE family N-acetylglucosaminyl deacetylase